MIVSPSATRAASTSEAEARGIASGDVEVAAGEGSGEDEGSGFDSVGDDAVPGAMELSDALYSNGGCAGALDFCAHGVQQRRQVGDFRFTGAVLHDGFAIGKRGGHQQVLSAGDGDFVEEDFGAFEPIAIDRISGGFDVAVFLRDLGAEALETFDMQVDGTRADGASAGQRDASASAAG